jgi:hypothetical protein
MAEEDTRGVNVINPQRQISEGIVYDSLIKYKNAMHKSYFGHNPGEPSPIDDNVRIENQAASLREMISSQLLIIDLIAKPMIKVNCISAYNKKYKTEEERKSHPFKNEENDLKKVIKWRDFLNECSKSLRDADLTPSSKDDFMIIKTGRDGEEEKHLTNNFIEMRDDLAESFSELWGLLSDHEIVIKKEDYDEDLTYKEQEELFMERFTEA